MLLVTSLTLGTVSCKKEGCTDETATNYNDKAKKDDGSCTYVDEPVDENIIMVTGNITSSTTWTTGKVYILTSRIAVTNGATLTIQPGVIVKGEVGTGANATALIIARGAKLMAEGTASQPIIFTTVADEIQPGQIASPNLDPTINGLWGGLLILGNAEISADAQAVQIEGIPASDPNGLYGGTNNADNSGVIRYISIRHGGANIGEGNEINGLTLGGVGNGTVIENVEIVSNQDDGIEFFGGSVNVTNLILWNIGDDAVDTDQSWSGTLNNFIINGAGDECFELDGPEGAMVAGHTLTNGSINPQGASGLADLDANSNLEMSNMYFFNITAGQTFDRLPDATGAFTGTNFQVTLPATTTILDFFLGGSDAFVTSVAAGANTVGATTSAFSGWSWSDAAGELSGF